MDDAIDGAGDPQIRVLKLLAISSPATASKKSIKSAAHVPSSSVSSSAQSALKKSA
jgi:hypothetical protein